MGEEATVGLNVLVLVLISECEQVHVGVIVTNNVLKEVVKAIACRGCTSSLGIKGISISSGTSRHV